MTKKVFISLILLISYSLGFAHNFIPHHHEAKSKEHIEVHQKEGHHRHHNQTKIHLHTDHTHISHGSHYDEDIYDLLICFLHHTDHQKSNCNDQHYLPSKTNRVSTNNLKTTKLLAVFINIYIDNEQVELTSDNSILSAPICLSPPIEDSPLRGPPSFS